MDFFDSFLEEENLTVKSAFEQGYLENVRKISEDARMLVEQLINRRFNQGIAKGCEIWSELGFYRGVLLACKHPCVHLSDQFVIILARYIM